MGEGGGTLVCLFGGTYPHNNQHYHASLYPNLSRTSSGHVEIKFPQSCRLKMATHVADHGSLFTDPDFPAHRGSLFFDRSTPLVQFSEDITWLRPQDICSTPRLFPDNPQDGQVKQGILGDCWFLCACTALQKNEHLLNKVIPTGQSCWTEHGYNGSFTCHVWQFGQWMEVTIDDYLPCIGGKLCFSRCQSQDIFWLPLLEKAFAKLHGSYEKLWAGQVADALVDLTGGLAERWTLRDLSGRPGSRGIVAVPEEMILQKLMKLKDRCLMSCSVLSSRKEAGELGELHAFVILDIQDVGHASGRELLLLRIWNPWGRRCWKGLWQDGGDGWRQLEPAVTSKLLSQLQEGEFWMDEEEFLREFDEVTIGYPISKEGHLQSLHTGNVLSHVQQLSGSWTKGQTAGGCRNNSSFPRNPKFWLRVSESSEVCVALLQKHLKLEELQATPAWIGRVQRYRCREKELPSSAMDQESNASQAIGLHIWKVAKQRFNLQKTLGTLPAASTSCHSYEREVHLRCDLSPGYYLLIPSTFLKDVEGRFLLRVLSTGRISLSEMKPSLHGSAREEEKPSGAWQTVQLQGRWEGGRTAGGSRNFSSYHCNPRFPLSVRADLGDCNVKVVLRQHCQDHQYHPIGFHVFQVPGSGWNLRSKERHRRLEKSD
ncbi:calpain-10 isoform X2 [Rhinatrema bivittatum]|uniref:calpain-10 isoform X2 n=1 Tax=Rhinatrema bivittatum TaxID=194408 RepID=UPI001127598E|nr:calpain-10 isoform X2 [Rhinatrema bivittatum]